MSARRVEYFPPECTRCGRAIRHSRSQFRAERGLCGPCERDLGYLQGGGGAKGIPAAIVCAGCGVTADVKNAAMKYCTPECRERARNRRLNENRRVKYHTDADYREKVKKRSRRTIKDRMRKDPEYRRKNMERLRRWRAAHPGYHSRRKKGERAGGSQ